MNNNSSTKIENKAGEPRVIVSLTTYPGRIDRVNIAIESLMHQTRRADMIVLWLAEEQFPEGEQSLPEQLLALKERGLSIQWCRDIKSYKKLIPSAQKWPEDIIITADDDIIYRIDTIERLLECHRRHPDCVCTLRSHLMLFDEERKPLPYNNWKPEYSAVIDEPRMALFPTTGAGTLFPPGVLPEQAFDEEAFMSLCPKADDIWTKCMLTLAGVPVVLAGENTRLLYTEGTQSDTLYAYNLTENDTQLAAVLEAYNEIGDEEDPEDTLLARMNDMPDHTPDDAFCQKYRVNRSYVNEQLGVKVSVIIAVRNAERTVKRCLSSAVGQTLSDIEIICVDMASTDGTAAIIEDFAARDNRVRLIRSQSDCPAMARREAVLNSRGEYCIFPNPEGILAADACEQLYNRAEQGDTDILAFTSGVLPEGAGQPEEQFAGYKGRLRNKNIMPQQFGWGNPPSDCLHSSIFSGRVSRRAYIHANCDKACDSMYDYFLLTRSAEVYTGEQTPVYYAQPCTQENPESAAKSFDAINEFIDFAHIKEEAGGVISDLRNRCVDRCAERWYALSADKREGYFDRLTGSWQACELAAAITALSSRIGPQVLRPLAESGKFPPVKKMLENIGVAITERGSANALFTMTEVLDCIAVNRTTTLIGVSKSAASSVVSSAKAVCAGEDLTAEDAADVHVFADRLDAVMEDGALDVIVMSAGDPHFAQTALHARLRGIAVVALMTEPLCQPMAHCSQPSGGMTALKLANMIVTDSPVQQTMLTDLGLNARCIPLPAIRMMGGRSAGRSSANAVVWSGTPQDSPEARDIFVRIQKMQPSARMLMYLDGVENIEELDLDLPEAITVRRLRPDYGIFSDAAVHLMTLSSGTMPASLRAARTMGVPTVMYALPGEHPDTAGTVIVERHDKTAAAEKTALLLADRQQRDKLSAQAKTAAGANTREEVAAQWDSALNAVPHRTTGSVEVDQSIEAVLTVYEDGAHFNAMRLEEYRLRCERYEQMLVEAELRRLRETEAMQKTIDSTKEQLREKEHARSKAAGELEELRSSTTYKVGSALTALPRRLKKMLSENQDGKE